MRNTFLLLPSLVIIALFSSCSASKQVRWPLNSLQQIGGHPTTVLGAPEVVTTSDGEEAVRFNGRTDGLLVEANPLAGAQAFAIEVEFKPADAWPQNIEQRFLHVEDPVEGQRRLLLELRLNNRQQWYADFFLRHEDGSLVLIDSTKTHPVGEWATMRLEYQDGKLRGYVNGVLETSGAIEYRLIPAMGKVSIGTRMDQRSWFNGDIRRVTFIGK